MNHSQTGFEVGLWRTSSIGPKGGTKTVNDCAEVAPVAGGGAVIRNTKNRDGAMLMFTADEWSAFVAGVKAGEFDF
jgi:hypothetical protein